MANFRIVNVSVATLHLTSSCTKVLSLGSCIQIDVEEGSAGSQGKTQLLLQEEQNIEDLRERERAIRQLESDIVDVNTIFKDLATLVHEQGEMVDSIEQNVESSHIRVQEGTEQLRQAERYKTKSRKKKFILAVIGIVILAVIIGIIAWQAN